MIYTHVLNRGGRCVVSPFNQACRVGGELSTADKVLVIDQSIYKSFSSGSKFLVAWITRKISSISSS
jgi:hypothetical protein